MNIQTWFNANKVFIIGLLGSIAVAMQAFVGQTTTDWKVVGFAVFTAILSYFANNLRGQWVTILGVIGTLASTVFTSISTGVPLHWNQIILQAILAILAVVAPPAKDRSYEHDPAIELAKGNAPTQADSTITPVIVETPKPTVTKTVSKTVTNKKK
jgi:hypothetical protein